MTNQLGPITTLGELIEQSCEKYADLPAYSCLGQTYTFSDIEQKSKALAAWLQNKSGLQAGDRVIIQLPNLIQYPIAAYAVLRAGLVIVNTNPLYTTREMAYQFSDSGAKGIIILEDLLPKLEAIKANTEIKCVIATSAIDLLTGDLSYQDDSHFGFNQVLGEGVNLPFKAVSNTDVNDVCVLQYTGGTTGVSKGACLTHKSLMTCGLQVFECFEEKIIEGKEVLVCPLPLYHIYAFSINMLAFFSRGSLNILIPNPRDVDQFVNALVPYKITGISGINTLFVGLCEHSIFKTLDFSALRLSLSGGTTLTTAAAKIWLETTGCTITEGYGLSESSGIVCLNKPGQETFGSVGLPALGTDVELWDDNDMVVADGERGQLVVRGPQMLRAYWNMPEETAKSITADGFFKTGDVAVRLPNACIKIVDRLKDMIIVSGFNVFPNEVENVLTIHNNIVEAAVIGEPCDKTGEKVSAYITVNSAVDNAEILAFCRENLTAYKVPKKITIMEQLPKSTVGKILRRELRKTKQ
jgi:long-chain acyl-CoA synthetase